MSKQEYAFIPMRVPWEPDRLKVFIEKYIPQLHEEYKNTKESPEKQALGMIIHDVQGIKSKLHTPQYRKNWEALEHIWYPKRSVYAVNNKKEYCDKCHAVIEKK